MRHFRPPLCLAWLCVVTSKNDERFLSNSSTKKGTPYDLAVSVNLDFARSLSFECRLVALSPSVIQIDMGNHQSKSAFHYILQKDKGETFILEKHNLLVRFRERFHSVVVSLHLHDLCRLLLMKREMTATITVLVYTVVSLISVFNSVIN